MIVVLLIVVLGVVLVVSLGVVCIVIIGVICSCSQHNAIVSRSLWGQVQLHMLPSLPGAGIEMC